LAVGFLAIGLSRTLRLVEAPAEFGSPVNDGLSDGESVPDFDARNLHGEPISPQTRDGAWTLLFLAEGCQPCEQLAAELRADAAPLLETPLVVVINNGTPGNSFGLETRYDVIVDPGRHIADAFRTRMTPRAFVIGADGLVRFSGFPNTASQLVGLTRHVAGDPGRVFATPETASREEASALSSRDERKEAAART
jgi:peroxiredoxin